MALKDIQEIISQCKLFLDLTTREQFSLLRYFRPSQFESGHILIQEGQIVEELCITVTGTWEVFLPKVLEGETCRPNEVHLQTISTSATLFGEFSFFDKQPASASVRALEAGEIYSVTYEDFMEIVDTDDHVGKIIYKNLINILIEKLRKDNDERDWLALIVE